MSKNQRADNLLVELGLCESRTQAQRLIMAGAVRIGTDNLIRKPSQLVPLGTTLRVVEKMPYVSRGALKLTAGIEAFQPELLNAIALDLGASTGGFTDLLLKHRVQKVYAVDVGYGQLHQRLREDSRVVCLERTNARHLSRDIIPDQINVLTADVSFISLTKVLPACANLMADNGWAMLLVKPQFEAPRDAVGRGGVVRNTEVRQQCVEKICRFAEDILGWRTIGCVPSPIKGPKGNQEFVTGFRTP